MSAGETTANGDITVVIACFNYGPYLPEAVASAIQQDGGAPQMIVVDDGSTDPGTIETLSSLPEEVRVLRQANSGVAVARNAGFREADTPYLLVLDADDRLAPGALTALRRALEADPALGFAYGQICFFDAWEGVMRMPPYDPYRLLFRHNIGPTALMRREMVSAIGGYDPTFDGYEDWEIWVHALAHGWRGRQVAQVTHFYRRHGDTRHSSARSAYRRIFRQLRDKHRELYSRPCRRRIASESALSLPARLIYRWWWGYRPVPARLELALQRLLWRPSKAALPSRHEHSA